MRGNSCTCREMELLISMSIDNECSAEQLIILEEHLRTCEACRNLQREYERVHSLVGRVLAPEPFVVPPVPAIPYTPVPLQAGVVRRLLPLRALRVGYAVAAGILLFLAGQKTGTYQAMQSLPESGQLGAAYVVSTPSMWLTKSGGRRTESAYEADTEKPFVERIDRYRAAIGDQLRAADVDWEQVRRLVEAMGELRTDLELLTLHMAYLDIKTGSPAYQVAEQWEHLRDPVVVGRSLNQ